MVVPLHPLLVTVQSYFCSINALNLFAQQLPSGFLANFRAKTDRHRRRLAADEFRVGVCSNCCLDYHGTRDVHARNYRGGRNVYCDYLGADGGRYLRKDKKGKITAILT